MAFVLTHWYGGLLVGTSFSDFLSDGEDEVTLWGQPEGCRPRDSRLSNAFSSLSVEDLRKRSTRCCSTSRPTHSRPLSSTTSRGSSKDYTSRRESTASAKLSQFRRTFSSPGPARRIESSKFWTPPSERRQNPKVRLQLGDGRIRRPGEDSETVRCQREERERRPVYKSYSSEELRSFDYPLLSPSSPKPPKPEPSILERSGGKEWSLIPAVPRQYHLSRPPNMNAQPDLPVVIFDESADENDDSFLFLRNGHLRYYSKTLLSLLNNKYSIVIWGNISSRRIHQIQKLGITCDFVSDPGLPMFAMGSETKFYKAAGLLLPYSKDRVITVTQNIGTAIPNFNQCILITDPAISLRNFVSIANVLCDMENKGNFSAYLKAVSRKEWMVKSVVNTDYCNVFIDDRSAFTQEFSPPTRTEVPGYDDLKGIELSYGKIFSQIRTLRSQHRLPRAETWYNLR